mgnify:CR=1 FL=1
MSMFLKENLYMKILLRFLVTNGEDILMKEFKMALAMAMVDMIALAVKLLITLLVK